MKIKSQMTPEKLIAFSQEHLSYEIGMLYGVVEELLKEQANPYVFNALLESFVVHASVILDFFYRPAKRADDARAEHYMADPRAWKRILPPCGKPFQKFDMKRNKRVMHLSYKRLDVLPEERNWGAKKITKEIRKLVDLFLDQADPRFVHESLYGLRGVTHSQRER